MLNKARKNWPDQTFEQADATYRTPDWATDLVFSNAMFQWLVDHHLHVQRIFRHMRADAVMALQMPDNLGESSHVGMSMLAWGPRWSDKLAQSGKLRSPILLPTEYHDLLALHARHIEIWRTVFTITCLRMPPSSTCCPRPDSSPISTHSRTRKEWNFLSPT
jgi:trans-aconitate 2-methyltransferase